MVLDPLGAPRRSVEWIGKILCFVNYLAVLEFHHTDGVAGPAHVHDRVFRDPQAAGSEKSLDLESRGLAGMMAAQSLQIVSAQDPLTRLRMAAERSIVSYRISCCQIAFRSPDVIRHNLATKMFRSEAAQTRSNATWHAGQLLAPDVTLLHAPVKRDNHVITGAFRSCPQAAASVRWERGGLRTLSTGRAFNIVSGHVENKAAYRNFFCNPGM